MVKTLAGELADGAIDIGEARSEIERLHGTLTETTEQLQSAWEWAYEVALGNLPKVPDGVTPAGEVSDEQYQKWERQYRRVLTFVIDDLQGGFAIAYFRPIDRDTFRFAIRAETGFDRNLILLRSLWLGGDERLHVDSEAEDTHLTTALVSAADRIIEMPALMVKKSSYNDAHPSSASTTPTSTARNPSTTPTPPAAASNKESSGTHPGTTEAT